MSSKKYCPKSFKNDGREEKKQLATKIRQWKGSSFTSYEVAELL